MVADLVHSAGTPPKPPGVETIMVHDDVSFRTVDDSCTGGKCHYRVAHISLDIQHTAPLAHGHCGRRLAMAGSGDRRGGER